MILPDDNDSKREFALMDLLKLKFRKIEQMKYRFYYFEGKFKRYCTYLPKYIFGYTIVLLFGYALCIMMENSLHGSFLQFIFNPIELNIPLIQNTIRSNFLIPIVFFALFFLMLQLGEKMRALANLPIWIVNLPFYSISNIIPKEKRLWLFGCRQGRAYAENPKYLFEYVTKNCPDIKAIWVTKNRDVYSALKKNKQHVCMAYSPKGYYLSMRSGATIISHYKRAISDYNDYATGNKTAIIQLWHGSPMKGIGLSRNAPQQAGLKRYGSLISKKAANLFFPFIKNRSSCHKMLSASPLVTEALKNSFLLKDHNIILAGYPKNDLWLSRLKAKSLDASISTVSNVIFMPTWRNNDWKLFANYDFNLERLNCFCKKNSIIFNIKLHPYSVAMLANFIDEFHKYSNIRYCSVDDIYEIIDSFDMLITDYSSIVFDFILSDRPIIYTPFDYEDYFKNDAGFLYGYSEICAGPIARNWVELEECLCADHSIYSEKREALRNRFNAFSDNNSSERIVGYLKSYLSEAVVDPANWNS